MKYGRSEDIYNVRGKKALITGGTKGIGRELAFCLLENGCDVIVASRSASTDIELDSFANLHGTNCWSLPCDVTDSKNVVSLVKDSIDIMGRIDILINAAGVNVRKFIWEMDDDSWNRVITTNLTASFYVCREVSKHMRANRYGKIINLSSMKSFLGVSDDGYSAYCASKAAVNMLTKQLACELADYGITVNAIAPTFIRTAINSAQLDDPKFRSSLVNRIPVGRIGEFRDLMGYLLFLASDASQFITGQVLLVDGGISARQ